MDYILLVSLFLLIAILIILVILQTIQYDNLKKIKIEEFTVDTIAECERIKEQKEKEIKDFEEILGGKIEKLQAILSEKEARYNEINQDLDLYRKGRIKEINDSAAEYEKQKQIIIDKGIDEYRNLTNEFFNGELQLQNEKLRQTKEEVKTVQAKLEEERNKQATINEEIRRRREVEEKQDFYRIQLNQDDIDDVKILRDIAPRLRRPDAINKVIWTGYYQKPLAELRKRAAIDGSGVYKITRLKTGEIYIGQAVNVSTRWSEHCKAALGVGTLASSQLHRTMSADGCENFIFELLEEVEKDKLRERESYYIDFYDSKNYGLNTVSGDKK